MLQTVAVHVNNNKLLAFQETETKLDAQPPTCRDKLERIDIGVC